MKNTTKPDLQPMHILDYPATGQKVYQWATQPASRPKNMDDMRHQLDGLVVIPARYTKLEIVQGDDAKFMLRLPPETQVRQSERRVRDEERRKADYRVPAFYAANFSAPDGMNRLEFFFSRLADYTIRGCK